jgi:photosystem II stability/assembly factor-like uncharacterized protein
VLMLASLLLLSACGGGSQEAAADALPATPIPAEEDPGLVHVHGLGVNPADGLVYAATHFGLWQLPEEGQAERVGDFGYDFMGFTVVGPDHFQASGHPTLNDDVPPLLGLVESTDGGQTWHSLSLLGDVDFHALRVVHDRVYGWSSSDGTFMVSDDGREWDRRSTAPILDFVVDPDDPEGILATVSESFDEARLVRSTDGGRTWEDVDGPPVARLAWESSDRLWGVGIDGSVWRSSDGGEQWEEVAGRVGGRPEAFLDAGESLYAAAGGAILESTDDGATWEVRHRSEEGE